MSNQRIFEYFELVGGEEAPEEISNLLNCSLLFCDWLIGVHSKVDKTVKQCVAVDHNLMRVQCSVEKYNMMGCSTLLYNRSLEEKSQENKSTIFHQNTCNVMKLYKFLAVQSWSDGCCTKALLPLHTWSCWDGWCWCCYCADIFQNWRHKKKMLFFYQK